jgi:hypothetical membrane protein
MKKMVLISILSFVVMIAAAHYFAPPEYRWTQNTISELAAQGLPNQKVMQAGFIGFGVLLNLGYIQKFVAGQKVVLPDVLVMVYGLAILLSGFFSTAPFLEGVAFSLRQSQLHSFFATLAGISFSAGILYRAVTAPTPQERWFHAIFFLLVMGASLGFGLIENGVLPIGKGIVQRSLYLISFTWLALSV